VLYSSVPLAAELAARGGGDLFPPAALTKPLFAVPVWNQRSVMSSQTEPQAPLWYVRRAALLPPPLIMMSPCAAVGRGIRLLVGWLVGDGVGTAMHSVLPVIELSVHLPYAHATHRNLPDGQCRHSMDAARRVALRDLARTTRRACSTRRFVILPICTARALGRCRHGKPGIGHATHCMALQAVEIWPWSQLTQRVWRIGKAGGLRIAGAASRIRKARR
jgi:hypothetical protein